MKVFENHQSKLTADVIENKEIKEKTCLCKNNQFFVLTPDWIKQEENMFK